MKSISAIYTRNLGKRYTLGRRLFLAKSLRELLMEIPGEVKRLISGSRPESGRSISAETPSGTFWALRNIDLELQQGEVIGVIGSNGAGKSTLLRILSRITPPTEGHARIQGRVRSLLEVGTGFHPELTGRENIYLNGVILGMKKREIDSKFDEIVDFAEVEKFLDTPVKRYSTGMYVRLGFSVAAHLEPEILLVDEVLAVGDIRFQRKCIGKLESIATQGRTVLFVSHNMQTIRRLCPKALLLHHGKTVRYGESGEVIEEYLHGICKQQAGDDVIALHHVVAPEKVEIIGLQILDAAGRAIRSVMVDELYAVCVRFRIHDSSEKYKVDIQFRGPNGELLASLFSFNDGFPYVEGENDREYTLKLQTKNIFLGGQYTIDITIRNSQGTIRDKVEGIELEVKPISLERKVELTPGIVRLDSAWSIQDGISESEPPAFSDS